MNITASEVLAPGESFLLCQMSEKKNLTEQKRLAGRQHLGRGYVHPRLSISAVERGLGNKVISAATARTFQMEGELVATPMVIQP